MRSETHVSIQRSKFCRCSYQAYWSGNGTSESEEKASATGASSPLPTAPEVPHETTGATTKRVGDSLYQGCTVPSVLMNIPLLRRRLPSL